MATSRISDAPHEESLKEMAKWLVWQLENPPAFYSREYVEALSKGSDHLVWRMVSVHRDGMYNIGPMPCSTAVSLSIIDTTKNVVYWVSLSANDFNDMGCKTMAEGLELHARCVRDMSEADAALLAALTPEWQAAMRLRGYTA